jgi:hypothetical protein
MDTELLRIKIKKYLSQYEYVSNDYEETQYLFEKYKKEFYNECPKKITPNDDKNPDDLPSNTKNSDNIESNEKEDTKNATNDSEKQSYITKIICKLYKKLCLKTHPDKDKSNTYNKYFEEVSKAYNTKDFLKMLLLSRELNINTDNIYQEEINNTDINNSSFETEQAYTLLFEKSINDINEKIKTIKSTLAWNWALSNPEQKQQLRERFLF